METDERPWGTYTVLEEGERFMDAGIEHLGMRRRVDVGSIPRLSVGSP